MKKKQIKEIIFFSIILLLIVLMFYSGFRILEATFLQNNDDAPGGNPSKTIYRNGVAYFPRQDITMILVIGIDQRGAAVGSDAYINKGAADMLMLLVFDETNKACNVLQLNRDTMANIPVLGIGGKEAGSIYGQLALSHTYGSGLEDSCENTVKAVSNFLYGIRIDHYVSMRMDAIPILNDAVGGVTVNVEHDFSQVDPTIGMGTVTLRGEQALNFVRTRKNVGDQLNLTRVQRQKAYIDSFVEAFHQKRESDSGFILRAYEDVQPYLVTDCSANGIRSMVERYGDYPIEKILTPEGENVMGEEYFEFYVDEEKLDALILELFYAPKKTD